jgi:D-tyrosyl-tRNA(Tyr) deacylase
VARALRPATNHLVRLVLQRVKEAHVDVSGATVGSISTGLLILIGVASTDTRKDAEYLADKVIYLRIFPDDEHRMNRSILEVGGSLLVVSQFTLYGDCRKGRRPSFDQAAPPEQARQLYEYFVEKLSSRNVIVQTGVFQAEMQVHLVNDGPVTFVLDSPDGQMPPG